ncbi:MAG: hypothetical protein ACYC75_02950 [Minisyncoccota bacterium]
MKKYLVGAVFTLVLFATPAFSNAASLTSSQIQAILSLLSSFGANQSVINNVQVALNGGTPTANNSCYNFSSNLSIGMSGSAVTALQTALQNDGEQVTVTTTFDDQTASAVTGFQEKYAGSILTPNGLKYGTGYVGASTRAELNSLCANGNGQTTQPPPVQPTQPPTPASTPTVSITANGHTGSETIPYDTAEVIAWTSTNANSCNLTASPSTANWSGSVSTSGSQETGNLTTSQTFDVTCTGAGGSTTQGFVINVSPQQTNPTPTITITSPNGGTYAAGSNVQVNWTESGFTPKDMVLDIYNAPMSVGHLADLGASNQTSVMVTIPSAATVGANAITVCDSGTWISIASGAIVPIGSIPPAGGTRALCASTPITITATTVAPVISYISPASAKVGDTVTIYGSNFDSGSYVSVPDVMSINPTSYSSSSLTFVIPSGFTQGTPVIKVAEKASSVSSNGVFLTIIAAPQSTGLTSAQIQSILSLLSSFGANSTTVANMTTVLNGGTLTTTPPASSGLTSSQIQSILSLLSSFGASSTVITNATSVLGAASTPPPVVNVWSPSSISAGQAFTLTWSSTNATSCSLSATNGYNDNGPWGKNTLATSGSLTINPYPSSSSTYTAQYNVTCSGPGGSLTVTAQVTVSAPVSCTPTMNKGILKVSYSSSSATISWPSSAGYGLLERAPGTPNDLFVVTGVGGSYTDTNVPPSGVCGTLYDLWENSSTLMDSVRVGGGMG